MELIVNPPSPLSETGDVKENWKNWKTDFLLYLSVNCKNYSTDRKIFLLKQYIGKYGKEIVKEVTKNMVDNYNLSDLLANLNQHFAVHNECSDSLENEVLSRYKFFTATRKAKSIEGYIHYLRKLAGTCNFGATENSLIRDKIILDLDNCLRQKLFKEKCLDLQRLTTICKEHPTDIWKEKEKKLNEHKSNNNTNNASSEQNKNDVKTTPNNNIKNAQTTTGLPKGNNNSNPDGATVGDHGASSSSHSNTNHTQLFKRNCWRCDRRHPIKVCPAWGFRCQNCYELHHFTKQCSQQRFKNDDRRKVNEQNVSHKMSRNEAQRESQLNPTAPPLDASGNMYPTLHSMSSMPSTNSTYGPQSQQNAWAHNQVTNQFQSTAAPQNQLHSTGAHQNQLHPIEASQTRTNGPNAWSWMSGDNLILHNTVQRNAQDTIPRYKSIQPIPEETGRIIKNAKTKSKDSCVLQ